MTQLPQTPSTSVPMPGYMQWHYSKDPSLAPNVGPASTTSSVGRLPQSAIGSEMAHPLSSLAEHIPLMYAIPPRDLMYEQPESALVEQGRFLVSVSDDSVRSQASQGSEETLSRTRMTLFRMGLQTSH